MSGAWYLGSGIWLGSKGFSVNPATNTYRRSPDFLKHEEESMLSTTIRGGMLLEICYLVRRYHEKGEIGFSDLTKEQQSLYILTWNSNLEVLRETPALNEALIALLEFRRNVMDPLIDWGQKGYGWVLPWRISKRARALIRDDELWATYETLRKMVGTTKFLEIERYAGETA